MHIVAVAIKTPLYQTFDYYSSEKLTVGMRVWVNFAGRKVVAIVLKNKEHSDFKLKEIEEVIDETPILDEKNIEFILWCANYYIQPIGEVAFAAIPKKLRIGNDVVIKKLISIATQKDTTITLTDEQRHAIKAVVNSLHTYQSFLLHGITGSGKTEVYLRIAKKVIESGKQVLVLVPEIGLTPQMVERFATRLNTAVVTMHSSLNITQKLSGWEQARGGKCGVVLGTRSAIWSSMPRLGLIIVDEEHDTSFKQQSSPRYNAKNLAFVKAKNLNIPIVLGSATPSLETLKLLIDKKVTHLLLKSRASGDLPAIEIVDTTTDIDPISHRLQQKITQHLKEGNQVMIFINRRGYAPIYYCTSCNWQATCSACEKPLIYHRDTHKLKCHSCDKIVAPIVKCGNCSAHTLQVMGHGTQRLEENFSAKFNGIEVVRIDRDSTTKKSDFNKKLEKIKEGKPCIIIGTQMLAKGHDFPGITLVGVLGSDGSLLSSHFRASEYLVQLLIQVSGRSGRGNNTGEVIIQTNYADYPLFNFVKHHNYAGFVKDLLSQRKNSMMPPFSFNALICVSSRVEEKSQHYIQKCREVLTRIAIDEVNIFSPIRAPIPKKADYYYYHLNLYSQNRVKLATILQTFLQNRPKNEQSVRWYIDVDPLD